MRLRAYFISHPIALLPTLATAALALGCGNVKGPGDTTGAGASGACSAAAPYAGSLCGPDEPCAVLADDVLAHSTESIPDATFLDFGAGQAPTVALDPSCSPHVLTVLAWGKTMYSSRGGAGGWSTESTSLPTYSGALAFGAEGQPLAAVSDGDFNTTLWTRGDGWSQVDQLPGEVGIYGQGFGVDGSGALHAALWGEENNSVATFAGSWIAQQGPAVSDAFTPVIAVSATASAHVAYWARATGNSPPGIELLWWTSPLAPEVVATGGSVQLSLILGMATSAPDAANPEGKPHLVFQIVQENGDSEVVYATRAGPSQWTATTIVADTPATVQNPCGATSPAVGATCSYDYTNHQPLAIAASQSGDVRVFFAARHFAGTMTAVCTSGNGPPECSWNQQGPGDETDTISVAWIAGGSVHTAPLTTTNQPSAGTVAVDTEGAMHLALYDAVTNAGTTQFSTRYLRIGLAGAGE
jgi:hypothetical protein